MNQEKFPQNERSASQAQDRSQTLVEDLIRMADAGPELPEGGIDRLKETVRPLWRAEVRLRARRRRKGLIMSGLAAAAGIVLAVAVVSHLRKETSPVVTPVALLESVVGELEIVPADGLSVRVGAGHRGMKVSPGSWLQAGPAVRAALRMTGGQSLRLDSSTRVQVVSAGAVNLERGAVYIDSQGGQVSGIEVVTAFGTIRDIGTQFEIRHDEDLLVIRVREGIVAVESNAGSFEINSGIEFSMGADGEKTTCSIGAFDPVWQWVQEVAPEIRIEGRSVTATLDQVSRETGLEVQFSDSDLEVFADSTILHGSAAGLTPSEVPALVLPGCGLEAVRKPGVLMIQRIERENES